LLCAARPENARRKTRGDFRELVLYRDDDDTRHFRGSSPASRTNDLRASHPRRSTAVTRRSQREGRARSVLPPIFQTAEHSPRSPRRRVPPSAVGSAGAPAPDHESEFVEKKRVARVEAHPPHTDTHSAVRSRWSQHTDPTGGRAAPAAQARSPPSFRKRRNVSIICNMHQGLSFLRLSKTEERRFSSPG
jgi:hypothetical protein